jgi:hypothetical protein
MYPLLPTFTIKPLTVFLNPNHQQMAVGTYERTNRVRLVFAGHAYLQKETHNQKKERSVSLVSVLVIQTDWLFVQFICGNCHKITFYTKFSLNFNV